MVRNDRKPLLQQVAAERLEVELAAILRLHANMGGMYKEHGFEEARYIENVQAGWYRRFQLELKGILR